MGAWVLLSGKPSQTGKLPPRGIKATWPVGDGARIQGSLDSRPRSLQLCRFNTLLGASPSAGLPLAPEVGMRPRPGDLVSHSCGLSDWCRPAGTLPQDSLAQASGDQGLSLSRKVAEPPGNGASPTGGWGWTDRTADQAEPWVQPHSAAVLVSNPSASQGWSPSLPVLGSPLTSVSSSGWHAEALACFRDACGQPSGPPWQRPRPSSPRGSVQAQLLDPPPAQHPSRLPQLSFFALFKKTF